METKKLAYMALWILVWWILAVGAGTYASSWRLISMHWMDFKLWRGWFERSGFWAEAAFAKLVNKSVVNTDSWVEVTLTTTDSWALAHIQTMSDHMINKKPLDQAKVTLTSVKLDNWIKLTIVWSEADTIKKIQDVAANSNWLFPMWGMMKGWRWSMGSGSGKILMHPALEELVQKNVVNTASWAEVTLTTTDSWALVMLQGMGDKMNSWNRPDAAKVTIVSTKLANWIKLTITGSDADTIKKIQDQAANAKWLFPIWGWKWFHGGKGWMMKDWRWWEWFHNGMMRDWR
ncbi:MAG: hypothetical protein ACD_3C00025G0012 [uncultured bacterium (gcode 4)]|uniref:Uncharacterized protein n=1 Tax=uncultured bacterium (gcode 4) TaxID=1234023 RepID=K2G0G7_9BACT|nr:MAG: hypothetical protein ACD_3C00025G0012 [uncultured bacterium (gcode 4)]